jgi:hypothetical protein
MKNLKSLFAILCLVATSIVTVATSKKQVSDMDNANQAFTDSLVQRDYYAASNCPMALPQERLTIANERIQYPTNLSFYDLGIPVLALNLTYTHQVSGMINGRTRNCARSVLPNQSSSLIVYTCSENGNFLCQVSFEAVQ